MWRIDIKSLPEAVADALYKLQNDASLAELAEAEKDNRRLVEELLARKAEGRPLTPEEYDLMIKFVDRVEKKKIAIEEPVAAAVEDEVLTSIKHVVPPEIFNQNVLDSGLPEYIGNILQEAGYETTGDLITQMKRNSDAILKLQGIGPKALAEIESFVQKLVPVEAEEPAVADEEVVKAPEPIVVEPETAQPVIVSEATPEAVAEPAMESPKIEEPVAELSFDEMFNMKTVEAKAEATVDLEEEDGSGQKTEKKKKKKPRVLLLNMILTGMSPLLARCTSVVRKAGKTNRNWK